MTKHDCKVTFTYTLETSKLGAEYQDEDFEVTATRYPGDPGCHTLPGGDPGYPPSGGEVEIESVKRDGKEIPEKDWTHFLSADNLIDAAGEIECPHDPGDDPPDRDED